jgi:DNA-binding CsgD family transcriptional regulator
MKAADSRTTPTAGPALPARGHDAVLGPDFRVLEASSALLDHFGADRDDVVGYPLAALVGAPSGGRLDAALCGLAAGCHSRVSERLAGRPGHSAQAPIHLVVRRPEDGRDDGTLVADLEQAGAEHIALSALAARVLEGVAAGESSAQLASRLYLSRQGVEYHVSALLRKLNASNRTCLVSSAFTLGILRTDCWPPRVADAHVR